jgi:hypothetical protein
MIAKLEGMAKKIDVQHTEYKAQMAASQITLSKTRTSSVSSIPPIDKSLAGMKAAAKTHDDVVNRLKNVKLQHSISGTQMKAGFILLVFLYI